MNLAQMDDGVVKCDWRAIGVGMISGEFGIYQFGDCLAAVSSTAQRVPMTFRYPAMWKADAMWMISSARSVDETAEWQAER